MVLVFLEGLLSKSPEEILVAIVPGTMSMPNIHPLLVHFPIVLLPTFFFLDMAGSLFNKDNWRRVASWLLYLGALTAVMTVIAGYFAAMTVPHGIEVHYIIEKHKVYGIIIAGVAMILSIWRLLGKTLPRREANVLQFLLSGIVCVALILGADLGGLMVYKYGIGVEAAVTKTIDNIEHKHAGKKNFSYKAQNVFLN